MKKFEYKHFNRELQLEEMNQLGQYGWELVSHSAVAVANILSSASAQYYVFKREIINK